MVGKCIFVVMAVIMVGGGGCQFSRPSNVSIDAGIDGPPTLTVMKSGDGTGAVSSNPTGIDCGVSCPSASAPFAVGTSVTHAHIEGPDSEFVGWAGACGGANCTVTVSVDQAVTASFKRTDKLLTVSIVGAVNGVGSVTLEPPGAAGPVNMSALFAHGTPVTLTATWDPSIQDFAGWSGDCSGTSATCNLTMDAAHAVTATYTPR